MRRQTSASVRGGRFARGGGCLGRQHLLSSFHRGVVPCIHREAAYDIIVNTVYRCRQLPQLGCNRAQGSTNHNASSHRLSVGAEGEVSMILTPREGPRHSYRSIHPHKAVRQVAM